jgi:hypothetical protein
MTDRKEALKRIREILLQEVRMGAACHIHFHRACCYELFVHMPVKVTDPTTGHLVRVCEEIPDSWFDQVWNDSKKEGILQLAGNVKRWAIWELTKKGRLQYGR